MVKVHNFYDRKTAEKRCNNLTDKVEIHAFRSSYRRHRMTFCMQASSLAVAIAVLVVCLMTAAPAYAKINIPTDMTASPLCVSGQCATPFTAKLLMFEEFGLQTLPSPHSGSSTSGLPVPANCQSTPDGQVLDGFLKQQIQPFPTRLANDVLSNAWASKIKGCGLLPGNTQGVTEGRPSGEQFAHQRWDEFFPQVYFQSATSGARINGGLRDNYQRHKYNIGEFKSGGLYYLTHGTTAGIEVKIHPALPAQNANSVWTFDGDFPPKLLMARYGEPLLFRHYNALPIDVAANNGFGSHHLSTHEHNGHQPAESDGYAHAFSYPGEFYDYHWPMILAGHDSINIGALDPRAGAPDGNGGIHTIAGDWRETMSTHWFHDHMLDFTAQNVYKGSAAMMNYYSALDRGREPKDMLAERFGTRLG